MLLLLLLASCYQSLCLLYPSDHQSIVCSTNIVMKIVGSVVAAQAGLYNPNLIISHHHHVTTSSSSLLLLEIRPSPTNEFGLQKHPTYSGGDNIRDVLLAGRGGGEGAAASSSSIDLDRISLRLDSFGEYCLIASIILGAMIDIYGDRPYRPPEKRFERIVYSIHGISVTIGFLAAFYTTVVFSLFGLYAKTALGNGNDSGYMELLKATSSMRYRGFRSFMLCLMSFKIAFIMNLILNYTGFTRWIILLISISGTCYSILQFKYILNTASNIIFK